MRHGTAFALLLPYILAGQDIAGEWQGTIKFGKIENRLVVTIARRANGAWTASEVTPDEGSNPVSASSVDFDGTTLRIAFDDIRTAYIGVLNEARNSLKGTLTQNSAVALDLDRATDESSWRRDRTRHKIHFIEADDNVRLEVVDWGGSGRPLILLAGGNNHAHAFDNFAPKLTSSYRVYGISRRGSGGSSAPPPSRANYDADRLGDDVLAVIAALNLNNPILVGPRWQGRNLARLAPATRSGLPGWFIWTLDTGMPTMQVLLWHSRSARLQWLKKGSPAFKTHSAPVDGNTRASTCQSSPSMHFLTSAA